VTHIAKTNENRPKENEHFLLKIIISKNPSLIIKLLRGILWILSLIYSGLVKMRVYLYQTRIFRRHHLSCPVISVGNITVGGTGKTPFVKYLAQYFQQKGYRVAILSRGYKKPSHSSTQPTVVSDFEKIHADWETAGDEPYLLAKSLPGVSVLVGNDRWKSGEFAIRQLGANLILLDDGFSHLQLYRDIDIVLLDATNPFGYGYCLPRGLLREPLCALKRADIVVLTRTDIVPDNPEIQKFFDPQTVYKSTMKILGLKSVLTEEIVNPDQLKQKNVLAVSGIGNPESFEKTLESLSSQIKEHFIYPDHYVYQKTDIDKIEHFSSENSIDWIITTEKDAVKIKPLLQKSEIHWLFLEIELSLFAEKEIWDCIEQRLQRKENMV
jgi:tetraacyldisaccharide 4'-kinase